MILLATIFFLVALLAPALFRDRGLKISRPEPRYLGLAMGATLAAIRGTPVWAIAFACCAAIVMADFVAFLDRLDHRGAA